MVHVGGFDVAWGRLVMAMLLWVILGAWYAAALNDVGPVRLRWLADDATELSVVIGVGLITLPVFLLIFPPLLVGVMYGGFAATGLWQLLRSGYNRTRKTRAGKATVAAATHEVLDEEE